jgi:hypothetical protein
MAMVLDGRSEFTLGLVDVSTASARIAAILPAHPDAQSSSEMNRSLVNPTTKKGKCYRRHSGFGPPGSASPCIPRVEPATMAISLARQPPPLAPCPLRPRGRPPPPSAPVASPYARYPAPHAPNPHSCPSSVPSPNNPASAPSRPSPPPSVPSQTLTAAVALRPSSPRARHRPSILLSSPRRVAAARSPSLPPCGRRSIFSGGVFLVRSLLSLPNTPLTRLPNTLPRRWTSGVVGAACPPFPAPPPIYFVGPIFLVTPSFSTALHEEVARELMTAMRKSPGLLPLQLFTSTARAQIHPD